MIDKEQSNLKNKKVKKILLVAITALVVSIILISGSMAYYKRIVGGNKKYVITASSVTLVLDETSNDITIDNTLPQTDEDGMTNSAYTFSIENMGSTTYQYTIYLEDNEIEDGATRVSDEFIKFYLTNDSLDTQKDPALLSSLSTDENGRILETGTIAGGTKYNYTLRFWVDYDATQTDAAGKVFSVRLNIIATQEEEKEEINFAGINEEAKRPEPTIFENTSENNNSDGIYIMEDDDGPSYFYRGQVNNLVKFGEHKNYYVYQDSFSGHEFQTLEACESEYGSCDKVLKNMAGTPIYWRIIRINGDGTIRMIYAGTSPDATGYDTGVGISRYGSQVDDIKHAGYTYDRDTTEIESSIKKEIDTWYSNVLEGTVYDTKIENGKFCSDTSNLEERVDEFDETCKDYVFAPVKRFYPLAFNLDGSPTPTFKCATTAETYGGSYNLKAGLITSDEILAAGADVSGNEPNHSFYLYNGMDSIDSEMGFWTMTPHLYSPTEVTVEDDGSSTWSDYKVYAGYMSYDSLFGSEFIDEMGLIRPVINLKADVLFKEGTNGSTITPYEVEQNIELVSFDLNHDESGNSVSFEVPLGVTWRGFAGSKYAVNDYYSFSIDSENNILVYNGYDDYIIGYVFNSDSAVLDYTKASDVVTENHTYVIYNPAN